MPAKGDHADGIQLWTAGTNAPSKNIEISSNLIVGKLGAQMQGIFVTDQSGGKLPYSGITIKNNPLDRKSVVKGKSVSVRVDLGGRRIIKKKKINIIKQQ